MITKLHCFTILAFLSASQVTAEVQISPGQLEASVQARTQALQHEKSGDWREAIACWQKWSPFVDCIPGEIASERTHHITICLLKLGETKIAVSNCLGALFGPRYFANAKVSLLVLKCYQAANQVPDLEHMVDIFERATIAEYRQKGYFQNHPEANWYRLLPTHPIREALRIEKLQSQRQIPELITIVQDRSGSSDDTTSETGWSDWRCRLAANALASLGDRAVEPISSEILKPRANISWLIYSLGRNKATNALAALAKGTRQETSYNSVNFIYAIAQHGDAGHSVLKEIAGWKEYMQNGVRVKAQEYLVTPKQYPPSWLDVELPKLKQGSLPKSYPAIR